MTGISNTMLQTQSGLDEVLYRHLGDHQYDMLADGQDIGATISKPNPLDRITWNSTISSSSSKWQTVDLVHIRLPASREDKFSASLKQMAMALYRKRLNARRYRPWRSELLLITKICPVDWWITLLHVHILTNVIYLPTYLLNAVAYLDFPRNIRTGLLQT